MRGIGAGAVVLVVGMLTLGTGVSAQRRPDERGLQVGGRFVMVRQDQEIMKEWSPGAEVLLRVPLVGALVAQASLSNFRTHRWKETVCVGIGECPPPSRVTGWTAMVVASVGTGFVFGDWVAFSAVGFGRTVDSQSLGAMEYSGPTWAWDLSLQRLLRLDLGIEVGYRLAFQGWDRGSWATAASGGWDRFVHHQLSLGLAYAPQAWQRRAGR